MIMGIGVDAVSISAMRDIVADMNDEELAVMFTREELAFSEKRRDPIEYLATRFASKEALTKAIAPLISDTAPSYDMRIVETLNRENGSPYININSELKEVMDAVGIEKVHISISTEGDFAFAFAIVER